MNEYEFWLPDGTHGFIYADDYRKANEGTYHECYVFVRGKDEVKRLPATARIERVP